MKLGVHEIYNLLHNNPPASVAAHIRDNADNVAGSLWLLDRVILVKDVYQDRLAKGEPFIVLFANYTPGLPGVPSPTKRVINFSKAVFRFVVEGMPVESKTEATRRLEICETNDCGYFDGSICRHTKCGCFAKIKTFFATEHCPLGRW